MCGRSSFYELIAVVTRPARCQAASLTRQWNRWACCTTEDSAICLHGEGFVFSFVTWFLFKVHRGTISVRFFFVSELWPPWVTCLRSDCWGFCQQLAELLCHRRPPTDARFFSPSVLFYVSACMSTGSPPAAARFVWELELRASIQ